MKKIGQIAGGEGEMLRVLLTIDIWGMLEYTGGVVNSKWLH